MAAKCLLPTVVLQKVLAFQLATKLAQLLAILYPHLLKHTQSIIDRLQPVRVSQHGRKLRAWGRDYVFSADQASSVRKLVRQYELGLSIELPDGCFDGHPSVDDGVLRRDGGAYWLQEPDAECDKPTLVIYTSELDPYADVESEALALAYLTMHPEWTDQEIASRCRLHRSSLYRFEKYKAARAMLKESRREFKEWQNT